MTVFYQKDRDAWRFDFRYRGQRYTSPRGFPTKGEARDAEAAKRRTLRRLTAGLEVPADEDSPRIADWAETYMEFVERRGQIRDVKSIETVLRVALRFWGRRPDRALAAHEQGPYLDLTLRDPIDRPEHLLAFEEWMLTRKSAPATRNHYRSAMSRLYAVAMLPQYRAFTRIQMNPFLGLLRDRPDRRTATLTAAQIRLLLTHASPHLQLAIAIGALAPKLRLDNVLGLRWKDIADDFSTLTVAEHKTLGETGQPMTVVLSNQLQAILRAAATRRVAGVPWVVTYHRKRLVKLDTSLKTACRAAGVRYGLKGGVTYHTIRHSAATLLASLGVSEGLRKEVMGHRSLATTQWYTHLAPVHEKAPLEQLSAALPLADLLVGTPVGNDRKTPRNTGIDDDRSGE